MRGNNSSARRQIQDIKIVKMYRYPRTAGLLALALLAAPLTFWPAGNALAQRAVKDHADRSPVRDSGTSARPDTGGQKTTSHSPGAASDGRFSDQTSRSAPSERATGSNSAGETSLQRDTDRPGSGKSQVACENCDKNKRVQHRRDRECARAKYPGERFSKTGEPVPTRCDRQTLQ